MTDQIEVPEDFSGRGKNYQKKVVQALFEDHQWAEQMFEVLKEEYFDVAHLQIIVGLLRAYYDKYQVLPSEETFVSLLNETLVRDGERLLRDKIIDFIAEIKAYPLANDSDIIKDTALKFCVRKALGGEVVKIARDIQFTNFDSDAIIERMQKAAYIGASRDTGHDYMGEFTRRCELVHRNGVPTGFPVLDDKHVLNGGLEPGEIGTIIAAAGGGKSMMLVNIAANALRQGKNVLYYTLELAEHKIGIRFDANFSGIGQSDVPFNKELVGKAIQENCKGKLYIKSFPPRSATVNHFKNHIRQLKNQKGFKPDLVCIDYADIMGEVMSNVRRGGESAYESQGSVYEQIRAFSDEVQCPVWTASQGRREAASERILKAEHIAESFRKMHTADFACGLSRTPEDKVDGTGRLTIIKNRAGQDGQVFPISLDTSTVQMEIYDQMTPEAIEDMEENGNKRRESSLMKNLAIKLEEHKKKKS